MSRGRPPGLRALLDDVDSIDVICRVLAQALDAGCCGFLSKNSDRADLIDAITSTAAEESYFTRDVLKHLGHLRRFDEVGNTELPDREVEVLQLTADGMFPEEIAKLLHLSAHTVKNHLRHAMSKLEAHTQARSRGQRTSSAPHLDRRRLDMNPSAESHPPGPTPGPDSIGVVIADNDYNIRAALAELITHHPGLHLVGEAWTATRLRHSAASIALVNVGMPHGGAEAVTASKAACADTIVAGHTTLTDRRTRERLVEAGAASVFAKGGGLDLGDEICKLAQP